MITNSVVVWLCAFALFTFSLISGISVVVQYQELQHSAENIAIQVARSQAINPDISIRDICITLAKPENSDLESCEISPKWVQIAISKKVSALGRTFKIRADSRVGYGFYSQNEA